MTGAFQHFWLKNRPARRRFVVVSRILWTSFISKTLGYVSEEGEEERAGLIICGQLTGVSQI